MLRERGFSCAATRDAVHAAAQSVPARCEIAGPAKEKARATGPGLYSLNPTLRRGLTPFGTNPA